jgi:PAS domain S-box-containing protein
MEADAGPGPAVIQRLEERLAGATIATEVTYAAAEVLGSELRADRAGYALADATARAVLVEGLWGTPLQAATPYSVEDFGTSTDGLRSGTPVLVNDVAAVLRDHPGYRGLADAGVRAFLIVPVHERGKVVAFLFVHSAQPRDWDDEDLALATTIAERTRDARSQARIASRRRESDRQMMDFADAMPIQVWAADNYGMLYWYNRRVLEFSGSSNAALDGFGYQDIIHPDDLAAALGNWYDALGKGSHHDTQFRIRTADGTYRWFMCRSEPIYDEDGHIIRYLGTNTDIHDQKRAEEELARLNTDLEREVEARTQERDLTWKTATDLFLVMAADLQAVRVNPAWTELLGWSETELLENDGTHFIHPEDLEATQQCLATLRRDGDKVQFENRLARKGGGHVWVAWIVTRHGDRDYATGRDVTAVRNLIKAQHDLTHASRVTTLGELAASIAHEVNQPLAAIVANGNAAARWLERKEPDVAEARQALSRMVEEAKRASEIVARIRSLARRGEPDRAPCGVAGLLSDSVSLVRGQLRSLGADVRYEANAGLQSILVDRVQIQQVIINLLLNAGQAMAQAGSERRQIDLEARADGTRVEISVSDTGPGFSAEAAGRVFDAFFTTKPDGMGMGLSIARTIVEAHGGTLRVDPEWRDGARFVFEVPITAPALMPS